MESLQPSCIRECIKLSFLTIFFICFSFFIHHTKAQIGNALNFDGANDKIIIGNNASVQISTGTVECWIQTSNAGSSYRGLIVKPFAYGLYLKDNELIMYHYNVGEYFTGIFLNDNSWHHLAYSFAPGTNNSKLYLDGSLVFTNTTGVVNQNSSLVLGAGGEFVGQDFAGKMDGVRIWNTVRTEAEISANINNEITTGSSLVSAYYFNQGIAGGNNTSITSLIDSKSSNNGTLQNFALTGATSNFTNSLVGVVYQHNFNTGTVISNIYATAPNFISPDLSVGSPHWGLNGNNTFCAGNPGLAVSVPFAGASNNITLRLNVSPSKIFNLTGISFKTLSAINNGSFSVFINGVAYYGNPIVANSCPGISVSNTSSLALTGAVTIEFRGTNSGSVNNAIFAIDDVILEGSFTPTSPEIAVTGGSPAQNILDGDATPSTSDKTDFGNVILNGTSQTFTITNSGTAVLNISSITSSNPSFSITGTPSTVAIGASQTFNVNFSGSASGTQNSTITINNDDLNEAVFDFAITANVPNNVVYFHNFNTGTVISNTYSTAPNIISSDLSTGSPHWGLNGNNTFCAGNPGLAVSVPFSGASNNITLRLNVSPSKIFNLSAISFKALSTINNGSFSVYINGVQYYGNPLVLNACPGVSVRNASNLPLTGAVTIEFRGTNSGSVNNAIFAIDDVILEGSFTPTSPEIAVTGGSPAQNILDGDATPSTSDKTDFGNVILNGTSQTFTITNSGTAVLNISSITSSNPSFSITGTPSTVAIGASQTFNVNFSGSASGTQNSTITINNDDLNEAVFDFAITANVPNNVVYFHNFNTGTATSNTYSTAPNIISSDLSTGSPHWGLNGNNTFCAGNPGLAVSVPFSGASNNITLRLNVSPSKIFNLSAVSFKALSTINNGSFSVYINGVQYYGNPLVLNACPGVSVRNASNLPLTGAVTIEFRGTNSGSVNNAIFAIDDVILEGSFTPTSPEIAVTGGSPAQNILDGDATPSTSDKTDFGNVILNGTSQTFTITNSGTAVLNISSITSSNPSFSITGAPSTVAIGASQTFNVNFSGSASGTQNSTITINNDDLNEAVFDFAITANVPNNVVYFHNFNTGTVISNTYSTAPNIISSDLSTGSPHWGLNGNNTFCAGNPGLAVSVPFSGASNNITLRLNVSPSKIFNLSAISFKALSTINNGSFSVYINGVQYYGNPLVLNACPGVSVRNASNLPLTGAVTIEFRGTNSGSVNNAIFAIDDVILEGSFINTTPEINVQGGSPLVSIVDGDATPSTTDGTDFGNIIINGASKTFTIQNSGTGVLNISSITSSNPAFVVSNVPATVGAGSSQTFTVAYSQSPSGTQTSIITIINNDFDEATYDFTVKATLPENTVYYHDFNTGSVVSNNYNTAPNTLSSNLTVGSPQWTSTSMVVGAFCSGNNGLGFTVPNIGSQRSLTLNLTVATNKIFNLKEINFKTSTAINNGGYYIFVNNNQVYQNTSNLLNCPGNNLSQSLDIDLTGTVNIEIRAINSGTINNANFSIDDFTLIGGFRNLIPEINLQGGSPAVSIADGDNSPSTIDNTDFGNILSASGASRTFTVQNTGTAVLNISSITSSNAKFTITGAPATVAVNGSQTFTVVYSPTSIGTETSTITINNNDSDEAVYDFQVSAGISGNIAYFHNFNAGTISGSNYNQAPNILASELTVGSPQIAGVGSVSAFCSGSNGLNMSVPFAGASRNLTLNLTVNSGKIFNLSSIGFKTISNINNGSFSIYVNGNQYYGNPLVQNSCPGITALQQTPLSLTGAVTIEIRATNSGTINNANFSIEDLLIEGTFVDTAPEINLQGGSPAVSIADGDNSPSTIDNTDFGNILSASGASRTFTVQNTGTAVLNISSITSSNAKFTITGAPATVAVNGSQTFTVVYSPTSIGTETSTITINNNDSDEAVYDFQVSAGISGNIAYFHNFNAGTISGSNYNQAPNILASELTVGSPQIAGVGSVSAFCSGSNGLNMSVPFAGASRNLTLNLTVNSGKIFNLSSIGFKTISNINNGSFSIYVNGNQYYGNPLVQNSCPGITALQQTPLSLTGAVTIEIRATNSGTINNANFSIEDLLIEGTFVDTAPEINLQGGSPAVSIADGDNSPSTIDNTDFGNILSASGASRTFTVQNTGTAVLNISSITSSNAKFTITGAPATVAVNGSQTFTVVYSPTSIGTETSTITINNNDSDEAVYDFQLSAGISGNIAYFHNFNAGTISGSNYNQAPNILASELTVGSPQIAGVGSVSAFCSGSNGLNMSVPFAGASRNLTLNLTVNSGKIFNLSSIGFKTISNINNGSFSIYVNGNQYYGNPLVQNSCPGITALQQTPLSLTGAVTIEIRATNSGTINNANFSIEDLLIEGTFVDTAPEINLQGGSPAVSIADGDNSPSTIDNTDFGNILSASGASRTFTVQNTGTAVLNISSITSSNAKFTITGAPATVAVNGSQTFTVVYSPTSIGTETSTITINNNDGDEAVYDFQVSAGISGNIAYFHNFNAGTISGSNYNQAPNILASELTVGSPQIAGVGSVSAFCSGSNGLNMSVPFAGASRNLTLNLTVNSGKIFNLSSIGFKTISNINNGSFSIYVNGNQYYGNPLVQNSCPGITALQQTPLSLTGAVTIEIRATNSGTINNANFSIEDLLIEGTFVDTAPEINLQGGSPAVSIADGDNSPSTIDNTDFGNILSASGASRTFTVQNTGTAVLNISSITSSNAKFTITGAPATVAVNGSQTFTVVYSPTSIGTETSTITINNNDSDEAVYDFQVSAGISGNIAYFHNFNAGTISGSNYNQAPNILASELTVGSPQIAGVGSVSAFCSGSNGLNMSVPFAGASRNLTLNLTVNSGKIFNLSSIGFKTISNINNGSFSIYVNGNQYYGNPLVQNSCPGITALQQTPLSLTGAVTIEIRATNSGTINNANFSIEDLLIEGTFVDTAPEINLQGGSPAVSIADGDNSPSTIDNTDFGNILSASGASRTFTVQNTGTAVLNISSITSSNAKFTITGAPATVAVNGSQTFTVVYSPTSIGTETSTITINNNDSDEAVYDFQLSAGISGNIAYFHNFNAGTISGSNYNQAPNILASELTVGSPQIAGVGSVSAFCSGSNGLNMSVPFAGASRNLTLNLTVNSGKIFNLSSIGFKTISNINNGSFSIYVNGNQYYGNPLVQNSCPGITALQQTPLSLTGAVTIEIRATNSGTINNANFSIEDLLIEGTFVDTAPEINLQGGSPAVSIADGDNSPSTIDNTDFGNILSASGASRTFTVQNTGTAVLNISSITSSNAKFTITGAPATVAVNGSQTFTVVYSPTSIGTETSTITINNNDGDEAVYDFQVSAGISGNIAYFHNFNAGTISGSNYNQAPNILASEFTVGSPQIAGVGSVSAFCSGSNGLNMSVPFAGASRNLTLNLTVNSGKIFNLSSIGFKTISNINNGSFSIYVNGNQYYGNPLVQNSCPGITALQQTPLSLTGAVTIEIRATNSGTINNANFSIEDLLIEGSFEESCPQVNNVTGGITGNRILKSGGALNATSLITSPANVEFQAANSINLLPGFSTTVGTVFKAEIRNCQ